jgi:hypothetical protein
LRALIAVKHGPRRACDAATPLIRAERLAVDRRKRAYAVQENHADARLLSEPRSVRIQQSWINGAKWSKPHVFARRAPVFREVEQNTFTVVEIAIEKI